MTIGSSTARVTIACNGVTTVFPVAIQAYQASDITVIHTTAAGVQSVLTLNSDYSMATSGSLSPTQWSLTTTLTYPTGDTLQAFINPVQSQQTSYVQGQAFPSAAVQANVDRLTQMVQRLQDQVSRSVRAPDGDSTPSTVLPAAALRVSEYLATDANGNVITTAALPGTANTQASLGPILNPIDARETAVGVTPINLSYPVAHAWRYLTPTQLADVKAYTHSVDCTSALQNWLNACWACKTRARLPGGCYLISGTLIINQASQTLGQDYQSTGFIMEGDGSGRSESYAASGLMDRTVIYSNSNVTLLRYQQYDGASTDSGNYQVRNILFVQASAAATAIAVQFDVLGSFSEFGWCDIYQAGSGDGLRCNEFTQAWIHDCTIINRDWVTENIYNPATAYTVGQIVIQGQILYQCVQNTTGNNPPNATYWAVYTRSAIGVDLFAQYSAGLGKVERVSVRGFNGGIDMGNAGGQSTFGMTCEMCDVSNVNYGITVQAGGEGNRIFGCYFEGCETKDIYDLGRGTVIRDNVHLTAPRTVVIDSSASAGGTVIEGNDVQMSTQYINNVAQGVPNNLGITVNATAFLGATVRNNRITWGFSSGSVAGVVGLQISGSGNNPFIQHDGNIFSPNSQWTGGAGTQAINDATNSGLTGTGAVGFGEAIDVHLTFPRMCQGALGYYINPTNVVDASISGGVLTLGPATFYVLGLTNTANISSIAAAAVPEGHVYCIYVINNKPTFVAGANMKIAGSTNFTPGANGCMIEFVMSNGHALEKNRTAY